jgi:hypothetical protein
LLLASDAPNALLHTYIHIHTHTHTYIHTHIHTHTNRDLKAESLLLVSDAPKALLKISDLSSACHAYGPNGLKALVGSPG